jgi:hypothetical protein
LKTKTLYITAIFNLTIQEDLGSGIAVKGGVHLTNNQAFIRSLLSEDLNVAIGQLEFNALYFAKAVFYKISEDEISESNHDDLLCNFLANCKNVINELWLIKDHSIDIMLGFVEYPFVISTIIDLPYHRAMVHSNWVTGGSFTSLGEYHSTNFTLADINKIVAWGVSKIVEPFSLSQQSKSAIKPGGQRITRCTVFLQTARREIDLGIRITHFCSAFECLFSTDNKEMTHKLSERVAYFLESDAKKRIEIYSDLKAIYAIRSQVSHGSAITKKLFPKISYFSKKADDILRRVLIKLDNEIHLDQYYRKDNNDDLEKYLTELTLGLDKFASA